MSRKEKDLDEDLVRFSQFPLGEMPERANTTPLWDVFKEHIVEAASEQGVAVAPVHRAFNDLDGDDDSRDKGYIVFDGKHLTDAGHRSVADSDREVGYRYRRY